MALNLVGGRTLMSLIKAPFDPHFNYFLPPSTPHLNLFKDSASKITTKRNLLQEVRGNGRPCPSLCF